MGRRAVARAGLLQALLLALLLGPGSVACQSGDVEITPEMLETLQADRMQAVQGWHRGPDGTVCVPDAPRSCLADAAPGACRTSVRLPGPGIPGG